MKDNSVGSKHCCMGPGMCDRKMSISVLGLAPRLSASCWIGECQVVDGSDTLRTGGVLHESMGNLLEDESAISSADEAIHFHSFCSETI